MKGYVSEMKVLLVDAQWQSSICGPRLALGRLAGALKREVGVVGFEFLITRSQQEEIERRPNLFLELEREFLDSIAEAVSEESDIRVVGITGWSGSFGRMVKIARACKTARRDVLVVVGGPYVTLHERSARTVQGIVERYAEIDVAVAGEGEHAFLEIVRQVGADRSDGRSSQRASRFGQRRETVAETGSLFPPFWDPFRKRRKDSNAEVFFVESSRGCPYSCAFCDEHVLWQRYRTFSIEEVSRQIAEGAESFGSKSFRFTDSTIATHPQLIELCECLASEQEGLAWSSFANCQNLSEDRAFSLAQAGCRCLLLGIESGDNFVLSTMRKRLSTSQIREAVAYCGDAGIRVRGSFIVGYPYESPAQAFRTIEFAQSLHLDGYAWHVYQPPLASLEESVLQQLEKTDLDVPPSVEVSLLERNPEMLTDMHALPMLLSMAPLLPLPPKAPDYIHQLSDVLRFALSCTREDGAYDLKILAEEERSRRLLRPREPPEVETASGTSRRLF